MMDNVIKSIVQEELKKAMEPSTSKTAAVTLQPKKKTEGRLNNLLSKIRSSGSVSNSSKKKVKTKKFQLKWSRYDAFKEQFQMVKSGDGGGYRFLKVEEGQPKTVLKADAVKLYFDKDGRNSFSEHESECYLALCGPDGEELLEDLDIWTYLDKKGLFLSKCAFILSTKFMNYDEFTNPHENEPHMCYETSFNVKPNESVASEEASKRRICSTCACTYTGTECLICLQNTEFNASNAADTTKSQDLFYSEFFTPLSPVLEEEQYTAPSLQMVREIRVRNLENNNTSEENSLNDAAINTTFEKKCYHFDIHRLTLRSDLIEIFKNKEIHQQDLVTFGWIDLRGNKEKGCGSGVSRDVYSSFWRDVSDSLFIGEKERVPYVRHDLYKAEWEAIGKIILKGYVDTQYFPILISKAFLEFCLFGEVSNEVLLESFSNYLSEDE
ncbi:uncharacterized protein LOC130647812 [Hydractinia symbiolongicarpus]|uniref:uncharacterized protein LOC130647812 n=1 Tax=Hydractinia symbiolongicarpus TaxID=13093 RepID=UPI00254BE5F6|nr:uncharacterized protein LOC130647812 [Hydractinia symbiolongicarpus]